VIKNNLILSLIFFYFAASGQVRINKSTDLLSSNTRTGFTEDLKMDFHSALNKGLDFIESPLHFTAEDFIMTGIIASATSLSFFADQPVRNSVMKIHSNSLDKIIPIGENFGNAKYAAALTATIYLGGLISGESELRKTGLILVETLFFNGLITEGLKITFGRARPYVNKGNMDIDLFTFEFDQEDYSLPSGHASVAFSVATVLSERIGNIYASAALYSLAGLTAFQRIYRDQHWFSDTILAAAIGTFVGLKMIKLNSESQDPELNHEAKSISFFPLLNHNSVGAGFSAAF